MQAAKAVLLFVLVIQLVFGLPVEDKDVKKVEKRSLYTEKSLGLTGIEKISKRSVPEKEEDMENAESGVYFLPSFGRRSKRSVRNLDDLDNAESGVYFLPSFARRRNRRSVDDMENAESGVYFLPSFARRHRRSADDDMDNAESGVYFLPSFARRG